MYFRHQYFFIPYLTMFRRFAKIGQPKNRFKSYGTDRVSTVEEAEIRSFERVKDNFWDESGVMRALHSLNKVRVPFVRDRLVGKELANGPRPLRNLRVLEVGCGVGVLSEPLARIGANMTGGCHLATGRILIGTTAGLYTQFHEYEQ